MATVNDLVKASLQRIGVLAASETPSAEDATLGLTRINELLDQWAAENLQIYTYTRTVFTITSGTATYNVGSGQTVNMTRPASPTLINHVYFQDTSVSPTIEYTLSPLTEDAYALIPQKDLTSPFPTSWYYNPTYPNGTLIFWPVPTKTTLQGVVYAPTPVGQFTALTSTLSLPPGYRRMIEAALAIELCADFGVQPSPVLVEAAKNAKTVVERNNKRLMDMSVDAAALIQGWDHTYYWSIYTGP